MKLIDVFPSWMVGGGIFSKLGNTVPWADDETVSPTALDIEYFGNHAGSRETSVLIDKMIHPDNYQPLTDVEIGRLVDVILTKYNKNWTRLWALNVAEYEALENYNMVEVETPDLEDKVTRDVTTTDHEGVNTSITEEASKKQDVTTETTHATDTTVETKHKTDMTVETKQATDTTSETTHAVDMSETQTKSIKSLGSSDFAGAEKTVIDRDGSANTNKDTTHTTGQANNNVNTQHSTGAADNNVDTVRTTGDADDNIDTVRVTGDAEDNVETVTTTGDAELNYKDGSGSIDEDITTTHKGTRTLTRHGNIGVTTSQQMAETEIALWKWNFFGDVFRDIDTVLTAPFWRLNV